MDKLQVKKPFFIFNPKSYLYGNDLLELAKVADDLAGKYKDKVTIFVTGPFADLKAIKDSTENIIVTAQHMDGIPLGRGMGYVTAESIYNSGARATFLNHAEHQLTLSELINSVNRAKEMGIVSVVCADSLEEAEIVAHLNPDIILCEPTELIGTGQTSDDYYIEKTNEAIRKVNSDILVMQAAGISTDEDVFRTISLGADGTGCTSGIVKAENPKDMLAKMIEACIKAFEGSN